MSNDPPVPSEPTPQQQQALSSWDEEGGAGPQGAFDGLEEFESAVPELTDAELVQLRMRVIALENVMIAMLAGASDRQLDLAREMAAYISPRPGATAHPLTTRAAAQMLHLVDRAAHFGSASPGARPYRSTPVFDEATLPAALRAEHRTKPGVWGVIRVLDGKLRYRTLDPPSELVLSPGHPGLVRPEEPHLVEPLGRMRMQVEFYHQPPQL